MSTPVEKPPLGIKPRFLHDEARFTEIAAAIVRYTVAKLPVPEEWLAEFDELTARIERRAKDQAAAKLPSYVVHRDESDSWYVRLANAKLLRVHPPTACATDDTCLVHKPSDHHMLGWSLNWRTDWGVGQMERLCPHGIGHPDPDDVAHHERQGRKGFDVHGCDGCCAPPS